MKNFDIDAFLNNSFKKFEKKKKNENKMEIEKERTDNLFSNIIDKNIYNTLNINLPENKNNNLNEFLKELFPNEKVFENEYTSEKVFVLDKFIKTQIKNKKRISKSNYTKNLISKIKKDKISYESLLPMNKIWNEYINNLLNGTLNEEIIAGKFLKADLHGAMIEVINSNNKNNIGIKGILIFESRRTFNILTKENKVKTILKPGSLFEITFNNIEIQILGDNFLYKSAERTKAKYKIRYTLNNTYLNNLMNI